MEFLGRGRANPRTVCLAWEILQSFEVLQDAPLGPFPASQSLLSAASPTPRTMQPLQAKKPDGRTQSAGPSEQIVSTGTWRRGEYPAPASPTESRRTSTKQPFDTKHTSASLDPVQSIMFPFGLGGVTELRWMRSRARFTSVLLRSTTVCWPSQGSNLWGKEKD